MREGLFTRLNLETGAVAPCSARCNILWYAQKVAQDARVLGRHEIIGFRKH